jgi:hypothetical protein
MSPKKTPDAAAPLRRIAVHVEEAQPGRFAWVLSELPRAPGASWSEIGKAGKPARSYQEAMAQGLWALQSMVDDLETGPRGSAEEADGDEAKGDEPASESPAAKGGARTAFGFGLIG